MKLKTALGVITNKYKDDSICEACGKSFKCGISLSGCWCMKVELDDEQRAEIKEKFDRCLCPACLDKVAREKA